jgi:predicted transcriptional regulator
MRGDCPEAVAVIGRFMDFLEKILLVYLACVLHCFTMNTITIRLPEGIRSDLQKLSQAQNKPVSVIVRESIRRYIAVEKFRGLRKKVLPFAEAQGFLTDEDIFKAIS